MNLRQKLEQIKNKEVTSYGAPTHNYKSGDLLTISGLKQVKNGKTKTILEGRKAIIVESSKKPTVVRAILLDYQNKLQNCIISLPVENITKFENKELYNKLNSK
jgi:hypothetical protein